MNILFLLLQIFEELGFEIIEKIDLESFRNKINVENLSFKFINNKYKLIIDYDKEIENLNGNIKGYHQTTVDNRPDFLISLYDLEDNLLKGIVVEVKCCKVKNIIQTNKKINAKFEVEKQLDDYTMIRYWNGNKNLSVISEVLLIYPKQNEKITREMLKSRRLSGINPIEIKIQKTIEETEGYSILFDAMDNFIDI